MEGLPREEKAQILGLNAARLFNIEVPARFAAATAGR
jgi:hypothetical protein